MGYHICRNWINPNFIFVNHIITSKTRSAVMNFFYQMTSQFIHPLVHHYTPSLSLIITHDPAEINITTPTTLHITKSDRWVRALHFGFLAHTAGSGCGKAASWWITSISTFASIFVQFESRSLPASIAAMSPDLLSPNSVPYSTVKFKGWGPKIPVFRYIMILFYSDIDVWRWRKDRNLIVEKHSLISALFLYSFSI